MSWNFIDYDNQWEDSFEVAVGTDDDWAYAEMWNPAPFVGPDTFVTYAGAELLDGQTYYLRLRVHNSLAWSEWYETSFRMNSVPSEPALSSPPDSAIVSTTTPYLYVLNSTDAEGDDLFYDIFVEVDCVLYAGSDIPEQIDTTGWQVDPPLFDNWIYFWSARAFDGYEYSDMSSYRTFWVNAIEEPPSPFDLSWPPDTGWSQVYQFPTTFWWGMSHDYDPFDSVYYRLEIAIDSEFTFVATYDSIYATTDTVLLDYSTHYWYKVTAVDTKDNETVSNGIGDFMTWILGDVNHDFAANVGDAVFLINYIFKSGYPPINMKAGDCNGDCCVNVGDAVYMINYVFKSGPDPLIGCDNCD
ncbi:MAG: hypothetical protein GY841_19625 [FCB group bacterium]|nr:hypothetical protein [FCB group bacterium]